MTIRILLADDHTIIRDGLRFLLEAQADLAVVGDVADGQQAVLLAQRLRPNVVVMDIAMPQLNGIEATQQIRATCPTTQVIILSIHSTSEHIFRALQAGAQGYLLKESAGSEVVAAVRAVHAGQRYLSEKITGILIDNSLQRRPGDARSPLESLSAREREILQWVAESQSSAEIARRLNLSVKTVETYRSRLMRKLGLKDLPALVRFAIQHGLTPLE